MDTLDFGSSASQIDLGALKQNVAGENTEFHKLQELMQVGHSAMPCLHTTGNI